MVVSVKAQQGDRMRRFLPLFLLLALTVAAAPFPKPDATKEDLKLIQGEWVCIHAIEGGRPDADFKETLSFEVSSGTWMNTWIKRGDDGAFSITTVLDPKKKHLDFEQINQKTCMGIYRLEGDTLTICFRTSSRPLDLSGSQPDTWRRVYRRKKQECTTKP
jgi:uncharacterized protein (TIGR03067 family)